MRGLATLFVTVLTLPLLIPASVGGWVRCATRRINGQSLLRALTAINISRSLATHWGPASDLASAADAARASATTTTSTTA